MQKIPLEPLSDATRLINHGPVVIVTVGDSLRDNLFTVAWNTPIRKNPPMVAIECGKSHYSYGFIERTGELGINVPGAAIAHNVLAAGKVSGEKIENKFSFVGLTRQNSTAIKAPLVAEAVANLECRVCQVVDLGGSVLFIADVLAAVVDKESFKEGTWYFGGGLKLLHHLGGNSFSVSDSRIDI